MIIFGTKTKGISSTPVESSCESCNQSQQLVHIFQKYFHIFWIPVFPLTKQTILECQHCKKTVLEKEMSSQQKSISQPKRSAAKTPAYMFAGSVLIACLIGWPIYSSDQEKARTQTYVSAPAAMDIAVIEASKNQFQILKLLSVQNNMISFQIGNYVYKSLYSAKKAIRKNMIGENDYFSTKLLEMPATKYKEIKVKFVQREN